MSNPLGAILAGLAGGASTLGSAIDDREKLNELKKERAANALRQLAQDALTRQKTLSEMGGVLDTGKPTRGDVMSGIQDTGGSFAVPTGLGSGDATGAIQALAQAKQTEQTAHRFDLPDLQTGKPVNYRIDEEQTPDARAMRRLAATQRGQMQVEYAKQQNAATLASQAADRDNQANFYALKALAKQLNYQDPLVQGEYNSTNAPKYKAMLDILQKQADRKAQVDAAAAGRAGSGEGQWAITDKFTDRQGNPLLFNSKTHTFSTLDGQIYDPMGGGVAHPPQGNTAGSARRLGTQPQGAATASQSPQGTDQQSNRSLITAGEKPLSGIALGNEARVRVAATEGPLVLPGMDEFENSRLKGATKDLRGARHGGHVAYGAMTGAAGQVASGPLKFDPIGALSQNFGAKLVNNVDPDVLLYQQNRIRAARLFQLLASRGGSEAMVGSEAQVSGVAPDATGEQVDMAQRTRNAMFGKLGAVMQVLSPQKRQQVEQALEAIKSGDMSVDVGKIGENVFGKGGADAFLSHAADSPFGGGAESGNPPTEGSTIDVAKLHKKYGLTPTRP